MDLTKKQALDEITTILTECSFTLRWTLVEMYHKIGEVLSQCDTSLAEISNETKISERNLYRAKQFIIKYPDINMLPEGKNTSWHQICNKYLPVPKELKRPDELVEHIHEFVFMCKCGVLGE